MLGGEGLSYWLGTFVSAINGTTNSKRESIRNAWGGQGWELTLYLRIDILWDSGIGNPLLELTSAPLHSLLYLP